MNIAWDSPFWFEVERAEVSKCVVERLLKMAEKESTTLLLWNFIDGVPSLIITPSVIQIVENIRQQFDEDEGCELSDEQAQLIYAWLISLGENKFAVSPEGIAEMIRLIEAGSWYLTVTEASEGFLPERIPPDIADPINMPWMFCSNSFPCDLKQVTNEFQTEGIGTELQNRIREAIDHFWKNKYRSSVRSILSAVDLIRLIISYPFEDCGDSYSGLKQAFLIPVTVRYVINRKEKTHNSTTPWLVDDLLFYIFQLVCMIKKCKCNCSRITLIKFEIQQLREQLEAI